MIFFGIINMSCQHTIMSVAVASLLFRLVAILPRHRSPTSVVQVRASRRRTLQRLAAGWTRPDPLCMPESPVMAAVVVVVLAAVVVVVFAPNAESMNNC